MAIPPHYLPEVIAGLEQLAANGLRHPIPAYGIQVDAQEGPEYSYDR